MNDLPETAERCDVCKSIHLPRHPHNAQSLFYIESFREQHGRYPTWADAVAHCEDRVRALWEQKLKASGSWTEPAAASV